MGMSTNPECGVGPFPWRVTPVEWVCGKLMRFVPIWVYARWPDFYLELATRSFAAHDLPEMRRHWNHDKKAPA